MSSSRHGSRHGKKVFFGLSATSTIFLALVLGAAFFAFANTITVTGSPPPLNAWGFQITPNSLKPSTCGSVDNLITGQGVNVTGTAGNDLILAGPTKNNINGLGGNDCILAGAGNGNSTKIWGDSPTAPPPGYQSGDVCLLEAGATAQIHCAVIGTYP